MGRSEKKTGQLQRLVWGSLLTACAAALAPAWTLAQGSAEIMNDPMRPQNVGEAAGGGKSAPASASAGVQVILTSPERKLALIDGKVVPLGGEVRDGKLVGLNESSAVLHKDGSRDVLLMHPGIDKKPPSSRRREP